MAAALRPTTAALDRLPPVANALLSFAAGWLSFAFAFAAAWPGSDSGVLGGASVAVGSLFWTLRRAQAEPPSTWQQREAIGRVLRTGRANGSGPIDDAAIAQLQAAAHQPRGNATLRPIMEAIRYAVPVIGAIQSSPWWLLVMPLQVIAGLLDNHSLSFPQIARRKLNKLSSELGRRDPDSEQVTVAQLQQRHSTPPK